MPEPDRERPEAGSSPEAPLSQESDLAKLVAKFAAHGGGNLPAELSVDLALEVVLNEIVEQACLATGATGAAVILEREGEMVCRASSGANAPELGARLSGESGLTAECIKTRQVQRCDDAQADARADAEASRSLGVRSVMILPLLRNGDLAGVLEIFSSRPGAFGERDELTLEALAHRILKNLERAEEPFSAAAENPTATPVPPIAAIRLEDSQVGSTSLEEDGVRPEVVGRSPRTVLDVVTFVLGAAVVASAVLLGTLVGLRLGWFGSTARHGHSASGAALAARQTNAEGQGTAAAKSAVRAGTDAGSTPTSSGAGNAMAAVSEKKNALAQPRSSAAGSNDSFPPAGGLSVYENGKEVFRMPPAGAEDAATKATGADGTAVQRAAAVEPSRVLEVSPEVAEGSLLHRVEPDYPEEARRQQIQGAVVLDVRTGRDGSIQEVKLLSGQRLLADAAIAAVKQWRFKPRLVKGQPVDMQTKVTLNFRLPR
jgi:TonB family protein